MVSPFFNDPFFGRLFGERFGIPRERIQNSLGSGVLVEQRGRRRHQQPRHPGQRRGRDHRGAGRRARVSGQAHPQGRADRSCRAPPRRRGRAVPLDRVQRFRQPRSRRYRACHRRSVRRRADGDERHRLGAGAHASRHLRLSVLHPDRRGHQSRQFRRRAGRHGRTAGRHQYRDLLQERRLARHRICDSFQHGTARRSVGAQGRQGAAALARRLVAKRSRRTSPTGSGSTRRRARWSPRFTPRVRRPGGLAAPAMSWSASTTSRSRTRKPSNTASSPRASAARRSSASCARARRSRPRSRWLRRSKTRRAMRAISPAAIRCRAAKSPICRPPVAEELGMDEEAAGRRRARGQGEDAGGEARRQARRHRRRAQQREDEVGGSAGERARRCRRRLAAGGRARGKVFNLAIQG